MTIKKKLILSNILMLFVPALLALIFGGIVFKAYGEKYWDALEEMYDNEHGVYSAQNMIYAYKDELGEEGRISLSGTRDVAASLERELNAMGYHVQIVIDQKTVYSDLDQEYIETVWGAGYRFSIL